MFGSTVTNTAAQPPPVFHQSYALVLAYERVPRLALFPLGTAIVIPIAFWVLNLVTVGHAHMLFTLTMALYAAGIATIHQYAHNAEEIVKSQTRNTVRLPLAAILGGLAVMYVITRFTGDYLAWFPSNIAMIALFGRIALAVSVIVIAVFFRYFGPLSIMRCSSVPLVSNFKRSVLDMVLQPFPYFFQDRFSEQRLGRRYHYPSANKILMLFVLFLVLGSALFVARPMPAQGRAAALVCCILILVSPLYKYVGQSNHEIDPRPYSELPASWWSDTVWKTLKDAIVPTVLIVVVALALEHLDSHSELNLTWHSGTMVAMITLMFLWGQNLFEECLRMVLFYPRRDITGDIVGMVGNSPSGSVNVVLGFLLSDFSIINDVATPDSPFPTEFERVKELSQRYGQQVLLPLPLYVEASLEEDVVRLGILEALGSPDFGILPNEVVENWRDMAIASTHGGQLQEVPCVPLMRGLCVVVGGTGEALRSIKDFSQRVKWEMSVGGLLSMEYSVTALRRFLWPSPSLPRRTLHQIQLFVPAALQSLYKLFTGLQAYREMHGQRPDSDLVNAVMRNCELTAAHIASHFKVGLASGRPSDLNRQVLEWVETTKSLLPGGRSE